MKKFVIILTALGMLATAAFASDTNSCLFTGNEFNASLDTGYNIQKGAAFKQPYAVNVGGGLQYYLTKNVGFEAGLPFYSTKGVSVTSASGDLLFRLPIQKFHLAPYVGVGYLENWHTGIGNYLLKGGLEYRPVSALGLFGEYVYQNQNIQFKNGAGTIYGGVRVNLSKVITVL